MEAFERFQRTGSIARAKRAGRKSNPEERHWFMATVAREDDV